MPLFVHPGPAPAEPWGAGDPRAPEWWGALTRYVSGMHAAWLAFLAEGRSALPSLRVLFAMLGGCAPLHHERLVARGGPAGTVDRLTFYDTSSYGSQALDAMVRCVGIEQVVYGSDRPVVEPGSCPLGDAARDATLGANPAAPARRRAGPRRRQGRGMIDYTRGRTLERPELEDVAQRLAGSPQLWRHLIRHVPGSRFYEQLWRDEHLAAWVICWMEEQDTGFHDHDLSAGAVSVVRGAVREQRLALGRRAAHARVRTRIELLVQRVRHPPRGALGHRSRRSRCTCTRRRCGAWAPTRVGEDGALARHSMSYAEELRPLTPQLGAAA